MDEGNTRSFFTLPATYIVSYFCLKILELNNLIQRKIIKVGGFVKSLGNPHPPSGDMPHCLLISPAQAYIVRVPE